MPDTNIYTLYIMLALLPIALFSWLFINRSQNKEHNTKAIMLNSVRVGQTVFTKSGIKGTVTSINGAYVRMVCPPDNTELEIDLESIKAVENYDEKEAKALMKQKINAAGSRLKGRRK